MASPSQTLDVRRSDIGDSLHEFDLAMNRQGYIGTQVFPVRNVGVQAGPFGRLPVEQMLQKGETLRASGSGYARGDWSWEPMSFATEEHGWEEPVDDRDAAIYGDFFEAEVIATQRAFNFVLQNAESRVATKALDVSQIPFTAVSTKWNDSAGATPRDDVRDAKIAIRNQCGLNANALVISSIVWEYLVDSAQIIDRIKYQNNVDVRPGEVTQAQVASALNIPRLIVAGGLENSANEGQSAVFSDIWSEANALLAVVAQTNDIREPCLGRTFHYSEDGSSEGGTVERYRDDRIRGDVVRVRRETEEKLIYPEAGHILTGVYVP